MLQGFADKDVYVCESRYSGRHKAFKKIKMWSVPRNAAIRLMARDILLQPARVASVFADNAVVSYDETATLLDKHRDEVLLESTIDGCKYYEQLHVPSGWIKLGDCVYIKADELDKPLICRVDKIWTDSK